MIRRVFVALLLMTGPYVAEAQARPMVPPGERVYGDIDRLAAAGLIDTLLVGARPFSEREVVRLLTEARRHLDRKPAMRDWAQRVIACDLARFRRESVKPIDALVLEDATLHGPDRGVPNVPAGVIDARIQPLAAYRGGRDVIDGSTQSLETYRSVLAGPYLALSVNPRAVLREPNGGGSTESDLRLQSGAVNLLFRNLSIEAGRDYSVFGQAPTGGLLLSDNAPALDLIRLSNDAPFSLPWWLRELGPLRGELIVADLGADHLIHPHTKLAAYHLSALPSPHLELGLEVEDAMGGRGGQPASFADRVADAIPIIDVLRKNSDFQFSNKIAGVDFHWRMPEWSGFEFYSEVAVDDFDARRLRSTFLEDGGYLIGTSLSCVLTCGRVGIRAEYHQTGIRYYTHTDYPLASNSTLLGDPLGPRGLGAYLTVDGDVNDDTRLGLSGAFEVRSGNSYDAISAGPHDSDFHFVQTAHAPGEKRSRLMASYVAGPRNGHVNLRASAGGERVSNFAFVGGADRTNWLASASIELRP